MALTSGTYTIISQLQGAAVGRNLVEDKSLLPKKVVTLPKGIDAPKWEIEALGDGNFKLRIGGGYTAEINNLLFSVLLSDPEPATWKIEPQFHQGENTYTIFLENKPGEGWIVPNNDDSEEEPQIVIQPLPATKSLPPMFFPSALFVIIPVE